MRILYVAPKYDYGNPLQGSSFEHNNFFDCLQRMGHDILYFDFASLLTCHGRAKMNQRLKEVAESEKPDLVFTFLASEELDKNVVSHISRAGRSVTLNWFADDHWRFDNYSRFWAPCFNWVVTTATSALPKYELMGYRNVIKSQWACNPFQYRRLDLPLKYEATFVGQPHGDRRFMVKTLRDAGIQVQCWGTGWESGRLTQEQMIEVFNQSRINLNFSNASVPGTAASLKTRAASVVARTLNYVPFGRAIKQARKQRIIARQTQVPAAANTLQPQIKGRNFEVPGCGGLMLSGRAENLSDYYDIGSEIVCFDSPKELVDQCKQLLANEPQRAAIAERGYQRTCREHSYVQRFNEIFQRINLQNIRADQAAGGTPGAVHDIT